MIDIAKKNLLFLLILDLYIFSRSIIIGSINVLKNKSTNNLHNQIRRRIEAKNGKVLIVGCGTSLLDIPKKNLNKINKEFFTVGMSFSCHLDILFDLYYVEFGGKHQNYLKDFYEKNLFIPVLEAYKNKKIKLLIHKDDIKSNDYFKINNLKLPKEITTHIHSGLGLQIFIASKLTKILKYFGLGFQTSGSLSYILLKLIDYGADEIILAGIDLDDKGYFFSDKKWKGEKIYFPYDSFFDIEYKNKRKKINKIHRTNNAELHRLPMREFLIFIDSIYKKLVIKLLINKGNLKNDFDSIIKK